VITGRAATPGDDRAVREPWLAAAVGEICRAQPRPTELKSALAQIVTRADLAGADREKLSYLVLHLAAQFGLALVGEHAAELERLRRRDTILEREGAAVTQALLATGCDHLLLRAQGLRRFYPPGWVRQYNDLDILVRNDRDVGSIFKSLAHLGYYVARPVVARREGTNNWVGVALNKQLIGLGHPMYVDLTTLGPALTRSRCLRLPDEAWRDRDHTAIGDATISVLDSNWQAVIFAVEMVERNRQFVLRDVVDLAMLHHAGVEWPLVYQRLGRSPLAQHALISLTRWAREYTVSGPADALGDVASRGRNAYRCNADWKDVAVRVTDASIRAVRRRDSAFAPRLVEHLPTSAWYRLGLAIFLLPPVPDRDAPAKHFGGAPIAGLAHYRPLVFPLVPAGTAAKIFRPPTNLVRFIPAATDRRVPAEDRWVDQLIREYADRPAVSLDAKAFDRRVRDEIAARDVALAETDQGWAACAVRALEHPLTGRREAALRWLAANDTDAMDHLLIGLELRGMLDRCTVVLGVDHDVRHRALAVAGFTPTVLTMRYCPADHDWSSPPSIEGFRLTHAAQADYPFVIDCLTVAVRRGLEAQDQTVDVSYWADQILRSGDSERLCLIGWLGDTRVCHGLAHPRPDRYGGPRVLYLVDVFVLPQHQKLGLSRATSSAILAAAAQLGYQTVESDVVLDERSDELLSGLKSAGWMADRVRWSRQP
jgi:hypothetical protein